MDLNNARKKVKDICDRYGFDIDPDMKIYDMSVSQKQTVEIVRCCTAARISRSWTGPPPCWPAGDG